MKLPVSRTTLARTALAALAAGALVLVACGGDDNGGGGDKITLDPAKADALAHAAILSDKDLPGKGWEVTKTDEFSDDEEIGDTAPCNNIEAKLNKQKAANNAGRAGRAEKEYTRPNGEADLDTSVEVEVNVFKDTKTPAQAFNAFKDALKSGDFGKCLEDLFKEGAGGPDAQGVTITVKEGKPRTAAPAGGAAQAYDFAIAVPGFKADMHYESYLWRYGNVGTTVTISGPAAALPPELAKAALDRTVALLEAAGKK